MLFSISPKDTTQASTGKMVSDNCEIPWPVAAYPEREVFAGGILSLSSKTAGAGDFYNSSIEPLGPFLTL